MIEYRGFYLKINECGCVIQDGHDNFVMLCDNESDATETLDDLLDHKKEDCHKKSNDTNWLSLFEKYCKRLPDKCYIQDKMTTTNEKIFKNFIKAFEKDFDVKVHYKHKLIEDQYCYFVDQIEPFW